MERHAKAFADHADVKVTEGGGTLDPVFGGSNPPAPAIRQLFGRRRGPAHAGPVKEWQTPCRTS